MATPRILQGAATLLIILLQLGNTHGQSCTFAYGEQACPRGTEEVYQAIKQGRSHHRGCCAPNADVGERMENLAIAEGCSTTQCLPLFIQDPCSENLPTYIVSGKQLSWEKAYEENCTVHQSGQVHKGQLAYCCHPDSLASALVSAFGAERNEFPHHAGVSVDGAFCGGTIYNKRWVITAAHCVIDPATRRLTPFNDGRYKINIGRNMWANGSPQNTYGVENVIVHEGYSKKLGSKELKKVADEGLPPGMLRTYNDIALIRLDRDIVFGDNVKALRLAEKGFNPLKFGKTAVIVGWGTSENGRTVEHLQKANFLIRSDQRCFSLPAYARFGELRDKLLCLGGIVDGQWSPGTGSGDSGGPAICRGDENGTPVLCGVTSFSIGGVNCIKNQDENSCYPSVFVEVANFKSWVEGKIPEGQDDSTLLNSPIYGAPATVSHQVQVTTSSGKSCGGTLIKPDVVITAAHCVMYDDSSLQRGIKVKTSQGQTLELMGSPGLLNGFKTLPKPHIPAESDNPKRVIMPDNFYANDMAILLLNGKVQGVNFPRLPERGETPRGPIMEFARDSESKTLRKREFKIVDKADCQQRMNRMGIVKLKSKVAGNILCGVEKYSGGSQCDRELGGGLICKGNDGKDVLCGVQSFRLCEWSLPNAFIDMSQQKSFVESAVQQLKARSG